MVVGRVDNTVISAPNRKMVILVSPDKPGRKMVILVIPDEPGIKAVILVSPDEPGRNYPSKTLTK